MVVVPPVITVLFLEFPWYDGLPLTQLYWILLAVAGVSLYRSTLFTRNALGHDAATRASAPFFNGDGDESMHAGGTSTVSAVNSVCTLVMAALSLNFGAGLVGACAPYMRYRIIGAIGSIGILGPILLLLADSGLLRRAIDAVRDRRANVRGSTVRANSHDVFLQQQAAIHIVLVVAISVFEAVQWPWLSWAVLWTLLGAAVVALTGDSSQQRALVYPVTVLFYMLAFQSQVTRVKLLVCTLLMSWWAGVGGWAPALRHGPAGTHALRLSVTALTVQAFFMVFLQNSTRHSILPVLDLEFDTALPGFSVLDHQVLGVLLMGVKRYGWFFVMAAWLRRVSAAEAAAAGDAVAAWQRSAALRVFGMVFLQLVVFHVVFLLRTASTRHVEACFVAVGLFSVVVWLYGATLLAEGIRPALQAWLWRAVYGRRGHGFSRSVPV